MPAGSRLATPDLNLLTRKLSITVKNLLGKHFLLCYAIKRSNKLSTKQISLFFRVELVSIRRFYRHQVVEWTDETF